MINKENCNNCRKNLKLKKYDYSQGGCVHTEYDGFCCLAFAYDGVAIHMVGGNPDTDVCEEFVRRRDYDSVQN